MISRPEVTLDVAEAMSGEVPEEPFTAEHAKAVKFYGVEYRKRTTIRAVAAPAGTRVETSEGVTVLLKAGFVATDGKSVWPISAEFMAENYEEVVEIGHDEEMGTSWRAGLPSKGS